MATATPPEFSELRASANSAELIAPSLMAVRMSRTAGPQVNSEKRLSDQVPARWWAILPLPDYGRLARHTQALDRANARQRRTFCNITAVSVGIPIVGSPWR